MSKVLEYRTREPEQAKQWWWRLLESSGGTALITVLVGGLLGSIIAGQIERGTKARELELVAYQKHLESEQEFTTNLFKLIGRVLTVSENLLILGQQQRDFDLGKFKGRERERVADQLSSLREEFNQVQALWRSEGESLGLLVGFYYPGQPSVATTWREARESLTAYMSCARESYLDRSVRKKSEASDCKSEKEAVREKLDQLTPSLKARQQYSWK